MNIFVVVKVIISNVVKTSTIRINLPGLKLNRIILVLAVIISLASHTLSRVKVNLTKSNPKL
jgi:hypothetical protein